MFKFKVGDNLVHRSHGVGIVRGIETREFTHGNPQSFYILEIEDCGASKKVFVPCESAGTKLREVLNAKGCEIVQSYLTHGKTEVDEHQTWNRRYREYMDLIHNGEAMQIAQVCLALTAMQTTCELSFGERKLLDQAHSLLEAEFRAAGVEFKGCGRGIQGKLRIVR